MEIREADEYDIPKIVKVLKASLGEDQLELSEKVWKYKHLENPFGKSIVLIADENKEIIGVRAFMRWEWQFGVEKFQALRAVDTATHPNHQGKGVFKKLTLEAVQNSKANNYHFIFNTPNEQSRPGYLKMGWKQVGEIFVGIKPSFSFLKFKNTRKSYEIKKNITNEHIDSLCREWNNKLAAKSGLFTPKSAEMLRWRYEENPLQSYEVLADNGYYLAAYVKKRGSFKEFRVAEYIYDEKLLSKKELKRIIDRLVSNFSCQMVSFSPNLLKMSGKKGHFGPVLTLNTLNVEDIQNEEFLKITNWNNSLGDLELF